MNQVECYELDFVFTTLHKVLSLLPPTGFGGKKQAKDGPNEARLFLVGPEGAVAVLDFYNYVMRLDSSTVSRKMRG